MAAAGDPLPVDLSGLPGASLSVVTSGTNTIASVEWTPTAADKAGAPYTAMVTFTDPAGDSSTICERSRHDSVKRLSPQSQESEPPPVT